MLNTKELKEKHSERYQELEHQLKEKDSILDNYKKEHGKLEIFFDKIIESITPILPLPQLYTKSNQGQRWQPHRNRDANFRFTHGVYARTRRNRKTSTGLIQKYVMRENIKYATKLIDWVDMHRGSYTVDECAVIVTGDLISGAIHPELEITNAFPSSSSMCQGGRDIDKANSFDRGKL